MRCCQRRSISGWCSEQHDGGHDQVVEVDGVVGFERALVAFVEHGDGLLAGAVGGAYGLAWL